MSQKGGAGKTTLAINLAIAAELKKQLAVIIDLDPQASSASWQDSRNRNYPIVISGQCSRLDSLLETANKQGADIVILDTAPHSEATALKAIRAGVISLIPCRPAILDLKAIKNTIDLLQITSSRGIVVFNGVSPRSNIVQEASSAITRAYRQVEICPLFLHQRAAFVHSLTEGQGAQEYEPESKAAYEISELYEWITKELTR